MFLLSVRLCVVFFLMSDMYLCRNFTVRLQLTNNAIEGSIPVELGFLTNLGVLGLGRNHLVGEIPSELGNLKHLSK